MSSEVLDGELITEARDGIDPDQAYKFEEFRSSAAGQDSTLQVTVYRQPANPDGTVVSNGKLQYMFQLPVDQLTREQILDKVAREYMLDTERFWYVRIHIRQPGKRGILFNELCTVIKQPKITDGAPASNDASVLGAVGKMLAEAQARTDALLARLMEAQRPALDPMELFMKGQQHSAAMFKEIATAMRGPSPGVGGSPGADGLEGLLKQIMVMKQIGEFMSGGASAAVAAGGGGSDIAEIIKSVMPIAQPFVAHIASQMAAKAKQPQLAAPVKPAQPGDTPTPAPVASTQPAPPASTQPATQEPVKDMKKEDAMLFAMREQLGQLADAIALNPPVESVGAQILENLPESYDDPLFTLLSGDDWFSRMSAVQSKLAPHRAWMEQLRDFILKSFTEVDEPAANDPPA